MSDMIAMVVESYQNGFDSSATRRRFVSVSPDTTVGELMEWRESINIPGTLDVSDIEIIVEKGEAKA